MLDMGFIPDIVTLGKPMGNGLPIAATVFRPDLLEEFGRKVQFGKRGDRDVGGRSNSVVAGGFECRFVHMSGIIRALFAAADGNRR
jgi:4-aminobutyrate aminotransferase-like enzyme